MTYQSMTLRLLTAVILSLAAMAFAGCSHSDIPRRLDMAESLIPTAPDSALAILRRIPPDSLDGREERALYALLLTQALDKNHLTPSNDSLISTAVDFYKSAGDPARLMAANFYRGRVLQLQGRYPQALLCFYEAKELAEKCDSNFWAGMACRDISDIYGNAFNKTEELTFAKKEYDYISQSGRQPYLNYALYDVGKAYGNNGDYKKAISIADQLVDSALVAEDAYLYYGALNLKSGALIEQGDYSEAYPILEEICGSGFAQCSDSLNICRIFAQQGRCDDAITLLDMISDEDPGVKGLVKHVLYRKTGEFDKAIKEGEYVDSVSDDILKNAMSRNLAGSLSDYFEMNEKISDAELRASREHNLLLIILYIVSVLSLILVVMYLYRRHRRQIDEKVLFAEQLQEELGKTTESLQFLLSTKDELLEKFISIMICNSDADVAKEKIADAVTRLIKDLSVRSEKINELEARVNKLHNNLFSDFRSDFPNLKEVDYRLFLFSIMRFSALSIALLLKEDKIGAVYNRKRRLKEKIKANGGEHTARYLEYF